MVIIITTTTSSRSTSSRNSIINESDHYYVATKENWFCKNVRKRKHCNGKNLMFSLIIYWEIDLNTSAFISLQVVDGSGWLSVYWNILWQKQIVLNSVHICYKQLELDQYRSYNPNVSLVSQLPTTCRHYSTTYTHTYTHTCVCLNDGGNWMGYMDKIKSKYKYDWISKTTTWHSTHIPVMTVELRNEKNGNSVGTLPLQFMSTHSQPHSSHASKQYGWKYVILVTVTLTLCRYLCNPQGRVLACFVFQENGSDCLLNWFRSSKSKYMHMYVYI